MQDTHSHYTGEVVSGGPSDVRDLGTLTIRKASVGPMNNNVYLLTPSDGRGSLLIDAAADAARINGLIAESAAPVATIVTTHRHPDHTGALVEIAEATGAETIAGVRDAAALPLPADRTVDHGDTITVGEHTVDVIALRGHTPGAIALAWTAPDGSVHLFTGDSLFPGGVGKTDSPEDFASLIDDVEQRLFDVYDDDA